MESDKYDKSQTSQLSWLEHYTFNIGVNGSNPLGVTNIGDQRSPVSRQLWELEAVSSNLASPTKQRYNSAGQSAILIRLKSVVRIHISLLTSAQCNGSIPVSKTVCKGSNPLVGANWFFGVTDSTKRYGRFSKGSNPLGTTN